MSEEKELTEKQQRFIEEYLVDMNATQAAIRAGYSEKTARQAGAECLSKPVIVAEITKAFAKRSKRTEVTADYVLANLVEVVERCMQRAPVMTRRGREVVQVTDDEGRDVWRFDAKGVVSALNLLGQHLAMFKQLHQHSDADGNPLFGHVDPAIRKALTNEGVRDIFATLAERLAGGAGEDQPGGAGVDGHAGPVANGKAPKPAKPSSNGSGHEA